VPLDLLQWLIAAATNSRITTSAAAAAAAAVMHPLIPEIIVMYAQYSAQGLVSVTYETPEYSTIKSETIKSETLSSNDCMQVCDDDATDRTITNASAGDTESVPLLQEVMPLQLAATAAQLDWTDDAIVALLSSSRSSCSSSSGSMFSIQHAAQAVSKARHILAVNPLKV
jgi:hypothetical protein